MWSLLSRKSQVAALVGGGVLVAWAYDAAYLYFAHLVPSPLKAASFAIFAVGTVAAILAKLLWRPLWRSVPWLNTAVFPDLNGTWRGVLISTWIDPISGKTPPPIPIEVTIRQGLFSTSVSLRTKESTSHSTRAFLEPLRDRGCYRVWYSYSNAPRAQVQHRSSPHEGVAYLEMDASNLNQLTGTYYTARKTTGDFTLTR